MKTSEDKLNEALRGVLKHKFDDYEEQPAANALDRIRARVKPARSGRLWWISGLIAVLIVTGLLVTRHTMKTEAPAPRQALVHSASHAPVPAQIRPAADGGAKSRLTPAASGKSSERERTRVVDTNLNNPSVIKLNEVATGAETIAAAYGANKPVRTQSTHQTAARNGQTVDLSPTGLAAPAAEDISVTVDSAVNGAPLEELEGVAFKAGEIALHLRSVTAPKYKPARVIVTSPNKTAWLFNVSALHSYQILTVPSSAAQDFQNFSFPTLFTAASMGMKLSGGIERSGVQVQLHYSAFKQTYSYEIANNNYLVKPDNNGQYQTVRQGDRMEENRKFSMLGIGLSKQLRWGHSPVSRFYAAFGAEYSHDLNSRQNLGWVNLGLGKQFAVTRSTAFSIGPYAEFSPVKVKGTANPFYYQPYRVGISAGLRFVKP